MQKYDTTNFVITIIVSTADTRKNNKSSGLQRNHCF